jgi:4-hydroxy-tetrahydrodipicolinate reductase
MMAGLKDYSVILEEIHHTQKVDAPSGTAITLAEDIIKHTAYEKWGTNEEEKNSIPIRSKRIDEIAGIHSVNYTSETDQIAIKHSANNRKGFALGALVAAEWLLGKQGVFSMNEVLNLS